jgi:acyl-ACP thioesterase
MFGERNFCIRDAAGQDLVIAESLWTYMDTSKMRPVKVDKDVLATYRLEDPIRAEWKGRKILVPDDMEVMEPIKVGAHLLDTNGHVNNGKYVMLAMEYVPVRFEISAFRVEYKRSALPGEKMVPYVKRTQERIVVVFKDTEEQIDTIVEFERGTIC